MHFNTPHTEQLLEECPILLTLPHGTVVRVRALGDPTRPGADVSLDYQWLVKGRDSQWQARKAIRRWFMALLHQAIARGAQRDDGRVPAWVARRVARDAIWLDRHAKVGLAAERWLNHPRDARTGKPLERNTPAA